MSAEQLDAVLRQLLLAPERATEDQSDRQLLDHFIISKDEAAFAALLARHGRLVFAVCRSVLHQEQDAEDAFQATFLVLARTASSIRKRDALASWLYGVALRAAMKARKAMNSRRHTEQQACPRTPEQPVSEAALHELQAILHEEVGSLPEKYRAPFVLCCLEGKSRAETAQELRWKEGTVSSRIAQARALLESRLAHRGIALPAALTAAALGPAWAAAAGSITVVARAAVAFAGRKAAEVESVKAVALAEGVIRTMVAAKLKSVASLVLALTLVLGGGSLLAHSAWQSQGPDPARSSPPQAGDREPDESRPGDLPPEDATDRKAAAESIDEATIAAYKQLGGSHYTDNVVMYTWAINRERGEKGVQGFHFYSPPEKRLPPIAAPFGLDLAQTKLSDADLKQMAHLTSLASLSLWKTQVSDTGLKTLAKMKDLRWLDLSETRVVGPGLRELASLRKLSTLFLDTNQLTDANLRILRDIGLLHAVVPGGRKFSSSTRFDQSDEKVARPHSAAEVTWFDLHGTKVTDAGVNELTVLKNLADLNLNETQVTDTGLRTLKGFTRLSSLDLSQTNVTDAGLKDLGQLSNLSTLNLANTKVTSRGLRELAGLKKLAELTLDGNQLTDECLRVLREMNKLQALTTRAWRDRSAIKTRTLRDIVEFNLSDTRVTDAGLKELAGLENLTSLALGGSKITPAGLKELVRFKKLTTLYLNGDQLTDASLLLLRELGLLHVLSGARAGTFLTPGYDKRPTSADEVIFMDLRDSQVTDAGLKELAGFKNLRALKLNNTQVTGTGLEELAGLNLTELGFNEAMASDAGLNQVAQFKNLTSLDITNTKVTAAGLKELATLKKLEGLYLSPAQLTDDNLRVLRELSLLHTLSQASAAYGKPSPRLDEDVTSIDLTQAPVTDAGLKELAGLTHLVKLNLQQTKVTGVGLKGLVSLKELDELNLNYEVTDAGLKEIAGLKNLTVLGVNGKQVTDEGVRHLAAMKQLTNLYVGGTQMTDVGLKELTALGNLRTLWLESNQVTDAGMEEVARLGRLTRLYLYEPKITDAGLIKLAPLKDLENVILSKTSVTPSGIVELRKVLPKCRID
jgi:RNA polymerase sigma factor (sigma-70 family)